MLKPVNKAAQNVISQIIMDDRCGDVCVYCDEPFDSCKYCDQEPCFAPDMV